MAVAVRREFGTQVTLGRGGAVLRTAIPKVTNSKEGVTSVFGVVWRSVARKTALWGCGGASPRIDSIRAVESCRSLSAHQVPAGSAGCDLCRQYCGPFALRPEEGRKTALRTWLEEEVLTPTMA
jgi:hypothetical protein